MEYALISNEKPEDHNMELVGLGNTRILTNYAPKIFMDTRAQHFPSSLYPYPDHDP